MLRKIGLVLATWLIGCVGLFHLIPSWAQMYPEAERPIACEYLTEHFEYIYTLHADGVEQRVVEEIVARSPDLDEFLQWPLYVATVLLFQFPAEKGPDSATWHYATQLGCVKILGTDFLAPRGTFRHFYKNPRKEI